MTKLISTIVFVVLVVLLWTHSSLSASAKDALRRQESFTTTALFLHTDVTFTRGEFKNIAVAENALMSVQRQDINKSKIIGVWAGVKSKEFISGFLFGREQDSKHGTE